MTKNTNIYIHKIELKSLINTHIYIDASIHPVTHSPAHTTTKMVRNEGGGNKMKHLARKHVNGSSQQQANKFLRVSLCKEEIYAYIMRLLGNSMCMVKCVDGYERLCHIRGKFTGRSKRENALSQGTWVLVGLRQWDAEKEFASKVSKTEKNIQKCDLLEIYSSSEREKLRVQEKIFQDLVAEGNNSDSGGGGGGGNGSNSDDEFKTNHSIEFIDQKTMEYQEIIAQGGKLSKLKATSYQAIYDDISESDDSDDDEDEKTSRKRPATAAEVPSSTPSSEQSFTRQKQQQSYLEEVDIDDI
jgi:initiation factor 1A